MDPKQEGKDFKSILGFISNIYQTGDMLGEQVYKHHEPKTQILIQSKHINKLLLVNN